MSFIGLRFVRSEVEEGVAAQVTDEGREVTACGQTHNSRASPEQV
jgi:hypothetical protein